MAVYAGEAVREARLAPAGVGRPLLFALAAFGLLAGSNALTSTTDPFGTRWLSVYDELAPWTFAESWFALVWVVASVVVLVAAGLLVVPLLRRVAAGLLLGAGVLAYLDGTAIFALIEHYSGEFSAPRLGSLLFALGGALSFAAGVFAYHRVGAPRERPVRRAVARAVGLAVVVAAGGLAASTLLTVYRVSSVDVRLLTQQPPAARWVALTPLGLALAALLTRWLARREQLVAGGLLVGLGALAGLWFGAYVAFADGAGIEVGTGSLTGLAAGCLLLAAGLATVAAARADGEVEAATVVGHPRAGSASTRYLCAAAELDERFADRAVEQVVLERHRAVATGEGVDLRTVLAHCLSARGRRAVRDTLLVALLLPAGLLLLYSRTNAHGILLLFLGAVAAFVIVFAELWTSRYRIAARRLGRTAADTSLDGRRLSPADERLLADVVAAEAGNVTVYSGYRPFVGSGVDHGGWSFAVNLSKGKKEWGKRLEPRPFEVEELYRCVVDRVAALGLDDLEIDDRLFADGAAIRGDERFVRSPLGRPSMRVDGPLPEAPAARAVRHYKRIRVTGWDGEYVVSTFLGLVRAGGSLYAEARYLVLVPLDPRYYGVDELQPRATALQRVGAVGVAAQRTPVLLVLAPLRVLRAAARAVRRWWRLAAMRQWVWGSPLPPDYGATTSVRELAQATRWRRHFQQVDRDMVTKIVERAILDALIDFLDEHNVDTSEIEEHETAILNNGVIVSGGTLQTESLAVGRGARSAVSKVSSKRRGGGRRGAPAGARR